MHAFSNHTYVIVSRGVGLIITALLMLVQQRPVDWWSLWVALLFGTFVLMMLVQPVMRAAVRQPWILGVDVAIAAMVIVITDPWNSPFLVYACAVLALPAVVSGWRGGLLAGLLCSGLVFMLVLLLNVPFASTLSHMWLRWLLVAAGPAMVGAFMPHVLQRIRLSVDALSSPAVLHEPTMRQPPVRPTDTESVSARWWSESARPTGQTTEVAVSTRVEALRVALYTPMAASVTVTECVHQYAERFEQQALIATRVVVLGRPIAHDELFTPLIRRVVIEALLNVAQHAHADMVVIMVRYDKRSITLLVHDDGAGLPATGIARVGLHSLQALMYRTSELGGRLEVFNHTPAGVAVRLIIPVTAAL
ncbi:MAG: sensor histidine kinase [Roseiflexaceae bacterium]|jgi:hypothetical protein